MWPVVLEKLNGQLWVAELKKPLPGAVIFALTAYVLSPEDNRYHEVVTEAVNSIEEKNAYFWNGMADSSAVQEIIRKVERNLADAIEEDGDPAESCWTLCTDAAYDMGLRDKELSDAAMSAYRQFGYSKEGECQP